VLLHERAVAGTRLEVLGGKECGSHAD
jgi:hypothetical protein